MIRGLPKVRGGCGEAVSGFPEARVCARSWRACHALLTVSPATGTSIPRNLGRPLVCAAGLCQRSGELRDAQGDAASRSRLTVTPRLPGPLVECKLASRDPSNHVHPARCERQPDHTYTNRWASSQRAWQRHAFMLFTVEVEACLRPCRPTCPRRPAAERHAAWPPVTGTPAQAGKWHRSSRQPS